MKIGYKNSDIDFFLEERAKKYGTQWSLTASFDRKEWQDLLIGVKRVVNSKVPETVTNTDLSKCLVTNGLLAHALGQAEEFGYEDTKLIRDFIHICGHISTPSMSIVELPLGQIAVIFAITRQTIKDNMSPRRNIDI